MTTQRKSNISTASGQNHEKTHPHPLPNRRCRHIRGRIRSHIRRRAHRRIEGRLRAVEAAVREAEEKEWRRTNPETRARAAGMVGQLEEQIAQLERSLSEAEAKGDEKAARNVREALETKRAWLAQISSSME